MIEALLILALAVVISLTAPSAVGRHLREPNWSPLPGDQVQEPLLDSSEPEDSTLPDGQGWWNTRVARWTESIDGVEPSTRKDYRDNVQRLPDQFVRLGFVRPTNARMVSRDMVEAYAHDQAIAPTTRAKGLGLLRLFLEFEEAPLAMRRKVWKAPKRVATRRRWATKEELTSLMLAAVGRERLVVALCGYNNLRPMDLCLLRVGHLSMEAEDPWLFPVRKGGDQKPQAMSRVVWRELAPVIAGLSPSERVYPHVRTTVFEDLDRVCERAGTRHLSPMDLRRGYAKIALYGAAANPVAIQGQMGHNELKTTEYYGGEDRRAMRLAQDQYDSYVQGTG